MQPLSRKNPGNVTKMPASHSISPEGEQQQKTHQAAQSALSGQQPSSQPLSQKGPGHVTSMPATHAPKNTTSSNQQAKLEQLREQQSTAQPFSPKHTSHQLPLAGVGPGHVTSMPAKHHAPQNTTSSNQQAKLKQLEYQKKEAEAEEELRKKQEWLTQQQIQSRVGASESFVIHPHSTSNSSSPGPKQPSGRGSFIAFAAFIAVFAICFFAIALS